MRTEDLVFRGRRVLTPEGIRPATVKVRSGRIVSVDPFDSRAPGEAVDAVDAGEAVVLPGVVDTHVHINEPGRTHWEGFVTATRAAAAGGVTTLLDMPLNSVPPTTSLEALHTKAESAAGRCRVHVGFWGGAVPGNRGQLEPLKRAGVFGFKCFLAPSGVEEFGHIGSQELAGILEITGSLGAVLLVHAEDPSRLVEPQAVGAPWSYASYLRSRPPEAEVSAVECVAAACRETGARAHILHVSSADAAEAIGRARDEGLALTGETCPHYLAFAAEEIPEGATEFKCAPPIRGAANRERLWGKLVDRTLALIASDHSPAPPELKRRENGDFREAWGGISSLELALPAVWSAAGERGHRLEDVADWMCSGPARLAGLSGVKGAIAPGHDADLVLFEPEAEWIVDPGRLEQRWKLTPYAGRRLRGKVLATYLKGEKIYENGEFLGSPRGEMLLA
jgi:allantoinase